MRTTVHLPGVFIPYSGRGEHPRGDDRLLGDVSVIGEPLPWLRDHGRTPDSAHVCLQELPSITE